MSVRRIKAGSTDVSITLRIIDSTDGTPETAVVFNTSGIDLWYRRELAASVDITEATLAALTTAHADGGFLHINDGLYRLDLPDAAVAAGVAGVQIGGTVTGMIVLAPYIELPVNTEEDVYGRIGAPAGASVSADIAAIEAQTDDIGTAGAGLTAVPWNSAWDAEVQSECTDALNAYDPPTNTEMEARTIAAASYATAAALDAVDNFLDTEVAAILADTDDIQTRLPAALVSGRMDASVGAMAANVMTAAAAAADLTTELQSGLATAAALDAVDNFIDTEIGAIISTLGTPAGASLAADIAAIEAQTDDIGTAGAGLTAIPWNAAWDAEVQSEATDALNAYDPPTNTEMEARTIAAANYATASALDAVDNFLDTEIADIQARLPAALVSGRIDASVGAMAANTVTASAIADNAIDAGAIAADAITAAKIADGAIDAATFAAGAIDATAIATDAITAAKIAANAIGASELAADAVAEIQSGLSTLTAAQVNTEVLDVLTVDTFAEASAVPAATSTLMDKLNWLFVLARNKLAQTSTTQTLYADDASTPVGTSAVSDDGTTASRAEWS